MSSSDQNDNPYHELDEESLVEKEVSVDAEQEQHSLDGEGDSDDEIANTCNPNDPEKSSAYNTIKYGDIGSYMKNKRAKIQIQHSQFIQSSSTASSSSPPIFQNLVFYINGHTDPPLAELTRRILLHGGKVLPYLDGKLLITHIIAGSLTPKKVEEFKNYKVVGSNFILECIEQGRRLDWREFRIGRGTGIKSVGKDGLTPSDISKSGHRDSQRSEESNHKLWGSKSSQRNLTGFVKKRMGEGDAESGKGSSVKGKDKEKEIDSSSTRDLESNSIGNERSKVDLQDRVKIMGPPKLPASVSKPQKTSSKTTNHSSTNLTSKPNLNLNKGAPSHMSAFDSNEKTLKRDAPSSNLVESKSTSSSNDITSPSKPTSKDNTSPTKSILPSPQTPTKPKTKINHRYSVNSSNALASSLLSSPTWRTSHTAVDSSFLSTYFSASRLHHLSIWKSQMKDLVSNVLRETGKEQGSKDLEKGMERVLFHVDFDSYFVNVGLRGRDELGDKPCVVCHVGGNVSGNGGAKSSTIATTASSSRTSPNKISRFSNSNSDLDMGLSSTSEIASCNYVARSYGINNGMSLGQARRTLADSLKGSQTSTSKTNHIKIVTLPYDFPSYEKTSIEFYRILLENSDAIEAVSIDEALIDVSFLLEDLKKISLKIQSGEEVDLDSGSIEARFFRTMKEFSGNQDVSKTSSSTSTIANAPSKSILNSKSSPAQVLAEVLRSEIKARTGCDASIGIGSNTSLARLATRKAKPNGSFHLTETAKIEVLNDLDVDDLHGVGLNTRIKIKEEYGTCNIGQLKSLPRFNERSFKNFLGEKTGATIFARMSGDGPNKLSGPPIRQSVGTSINYGIRFEDNIEAKEFVSRLSAEVSKRLKALSLKGRRINVTLMIRSEDAPVEAPKFMGHGKCDNFHRSEDSEKPIDDEGKIARVAWRLIQGLEKDPKDLRGVGISLQKLMDGKVEEIKLANGQKTLNFNTTRPGSGQNQSKPSAAAPPRPQSSISSKSSNDFKSIKPSKEVSFVDHQLPQVQGSDFSEKRQVFRESSRSLVEGLRPGSSSSLSVRRSPTPEEEEEGQEGEPTVSKDAASSLKAALSSSRTDRLLPPKIPLGIERPLVPAPIGLPLLPETQVPRSTMGGPLILPPGSQIEIDSSFLEALPSEMQVELRARIKRRSEEPSNGKDSNREGPESPKRKKTKTMILKQSRLDLRPTTTKKRGLNERVGNEEEEEADDSAIRKKSRKAFRDDSPFLPELDQEVLSSLGIDLDIFRELPKDLQKDAIIAEAQRDDAFFEILPQEWKKLTGRNLKVSNKKGLNRIQVEGVGKKLKSNVVEDLTRSEIRRRVTKSTSLGYLSDLDARGKGKAKAIELDQTNSDSNYSILRAKKGDLGSIPHLGTGKVSVSSLEAMRSLLSSWVGSVSEQVVKDEDGASKKGPRLGDVEKILRFLLESTGLDLNGTSVGKAAVGTARMDLEKVAGILRWWKEILRKSWRDEEIDPDEESTSLGVTWETLGDRSGISLGKIWWSAFTFVKSQVDERVIAITGCGLAL